MKKKILSFALSLALLAGLVVPAFAANGPARFTDVPVDNWAYPYVEKAAEHGWISGYTDGRFGLADKVSYAQFAVMVTQALFKENTDAYQGSSGEPWYLKYMVVSNEFGLLKGTNLEYTYTDKSMVDMQISRYEMGQLLYNTIAAVGLDVDADQAVTENTTGDWSTIPVKYRDAVAAVKDLGLITGTDSAGTFGGDGIMNRAQAAVVMCKLDEVIQNSTSNPPAAPEQEPNEDTTSTIVGEAADELLFSKEHIRFYYTGWEKNDSGYEIKLRIENDSDYKIRGHIPYGAQAKDKQVSMKLTCSAEPGRTAEGKITISAEEMKRVGLEDFRSIRFRVSVSDTQNNPRKLQFETGTIMIVLKDSTSEANNDVSDNSDQIDPQVSANDNKTVYVTKTGKRYHYSSTCNGGTYYESTLSEARSRGLTPCDKCVY